MVPIEATILPGVALYTLYEYPVAPVDPELSTERVVFEILTAVAVGAETGTNAAVLLTVAPTVPVVLFDEKYET
jgi:hypothetical protein